MGMKIDVFLAQAEGARPAVNTQGRRRQPRRVTAPARVLHGPRGLRPDAPRRSAGGRHHHPGLDAAVRHGLRRGDRHRRAALATAPSWPASTASRR